MIGSVINEKKKMTSIDDVMSGHKTKMHGIKYICVVYIIKVLQWSSVASCNTMLHLQSRNSRNTIRGPLRNWNVLGSYTCISSNVIYAITCTRCEKKLFWGNKEATGRSIH